MSPLEDRIRELLDQAKSRRLERVQERSSEMEASEARWVRFEATAKTLMALAVLPRIETVARMLPNAGAPQLRSDGLSAAQVFRSTAEYPIGADVEVRFALDPSSEDLTVVWKVSIIPILADYDREGSLRLGLNAPDSQKLGDFIDDRILMFVKDYLKIHEPDSPYRVTTTVCDPICGMEFPRSEAACSTARGQRIYFFCCEECRKRFENGSSTP